MEPTVLPYERTAGSASTTVRDLAIDLGIWAFVQIGAALARFTVLRELEIEDRFRSELL